MISSTCTESIRMYADALTDAHYIGCHYMKLWQAPGGVEPEDLVREAVQNSVGLRPAFASGVLASGARGLRRDSTALQAPKLTVRMRPPSLGARWLARHIRRTVCATM